MKKKYKKSLCMNKATYRKNRKAIMRTLRKNKMLLKIRYICLDNQIIMLESEYSLNKNTFIDPAQFKAHNKQYQDIDKSTLDI